MIWKVSYTEDADSFDHMPLRVCCCLKVIV